VQSCLAKTPSHSGLFDSQGEIGNSDRAPYKFSARKANPMPPASSQKSTLLAWDSAPSDAAFIGIDGARGGWVVAMWNNGILTLTFYTTLAEIPLPPTCRVLVDMPIGLPAKHRRSCDAQARALLGARRSTLFPVPTRAAVYASSYAECCHINEGLQGCRVSKQAWNISPKIRELDRYLSSTPSRHTHIAEGHPELAFTALNSSRTPLPSKRTPLGLQLRGEAIAFMGAHVEALVRDFSASHPRFVDATDSYDALSLCALLLRTRGEVSFVGDGSVDELNAPERICIGKKQQGGTE
jgi:predicted RNase H-like nuclease